MSDALVPGGGARTPPRVLARKGLAVATMLLSATVLVLCLAGALGVWVFNAPATRAVLAVVDPVEARLDDMESQLRDARLAVAGVREKVEGVGAAVDRVNTTLADPAVLREAVGDALGDQLAPRLESLGGDRLGRLGQALADAIAGNGAGQGDSGGTPDARPGLPIDLGVSEAIAAAEGQVGDAEDALGKYEAEVATWHRRVKWIQDHVAFWIDVLTVGGSLVFLWLALAHGALFAVALGFYTGEDPFARWRTWGT